MSGVCRSRIARMFSKCRATARPFRGISSSLRGACGASPGVYRAPLAVLKGYTDSPQGAYVLLDGWILSWSRDNTIRLWDGQTGAPLRVFASHRDWTGSDADLCAALHAGDRACHHSLHSGYTVADARGEVAVFVGGRHIRFCRSFRRPLVARD